MRLVGRASLEIIRLKFTVLIPLAPHAKPLQSWSLSSYDGSSVPGSPSLSVHGEISAAEDGLHFDGSTSSMDTYIEGSHCLHDTEICGKGFSFGTKLKIDKEANGYTEPKFVLDTGGSGTNTRGVSLFVEDKKLVAEVTTKNMRYRVRRKYRDSTVYCMYNES